MLIKYFDISIEDAVIDNNHCFDGKCPFTKTASENPLDSIAKKKDHAYLYVIAMGAGDFYGENNNGDFFYEKDLIEYYETFNSAGVFIQHFNKDPEKSIGRVIKAIYNDKMHRVELIIEIKKSKSPEIYHRIKNGERMKVSMGVKVPQEMCSYCGAITKNSLANRCEHLKFYMHEVMPNGQKVYAINLTPMNFFDISIVRKPADAQGHALFQKVASDFTDDESNSNIEKVAMHEKIATLIKYFDAMKSMPEAVTPDELEDIKLRFQPESIKKIIIAKRIPLLPSEAMFLGTDMTKDDFIKDRDILDSHDMILKLIMKKLSDNDEDCLSKTASIQYSNSTIDKLETRGFLVKEAVSRDGYGNKMEARPTFESKEDFGEGIKGKFSQYKVRFNNGSVVTVNGMQGLSLKKDIPSYYFKLVDKGFAHSISGVLPTGDESIIYMI